MMNVTKSWITVIIEPVKYNAILTYIYKTLLYFKHGTFAV